MTTSVVLGVADQVTGYELRSLLGELEDTTVLDLVDTSTRLEDVVLKRDPDVVLVHERLGPAPVLQLVRDLVLRRPTTAVVLLVEEPSPEVFQAAADAGARVLTYPAALEEVAARLTAAAQWSAQMRRVISNEGVATAGLAARGRLIAVAGSKGGVGTTTVATHMALQTVRSAPGQSVCLVELDLEKGDVGHLLGISHRLDVSDLAKVASDLGPQTVGSAVHRHESGVMVLLAPARIEDVGVVGDREVRLVLAALRQHFDVVVVDCGAHVNPVTAAAVEAADAVVLVSTPDVLALRGVHRAVDAWGRVGVRKPDQVQVLLNRTSRSSEVQPDAAARLVPSPLLSPTLPAAYKLLEPGLNHRSPDEVRERSWWRQVRAVVGALELVPEPQGATAPGRGRRRRPRGDAGQASLEFIGVMPYVLILAVVLWQIALWGAMSVLAGHAASEGARAAAVGATPDEVSASALDSVPSWFRSGMSVSQPPGSVEVRARLPLLSPGVATDAFVFRARSGVVREDPGAGL